MSPRFTFNDLLDCHEANAVLLCKRTVAGSPSVCLVAAAYGANIIVRQFSGGSLLSAQDSLGMGSHPITIPKRVSLRSGISPVTLSARNALRVSSATVSLAFRSTPLPMPVCCVLYIRSFKEMLRITARWVIAMVAHIELFRVFLVGDKVGDAVREQHVLFPVDDARAVTVPIPVNKSLPRPAFRDATAQYSGLESLNLLRRKARKNILEVSHDLNLAHRLGCGQTRSVFSAPCGSFVDGILA